MTQLHAQPYDTSATGFYFESLEEYQTRVESVTNAHGDPVEEFEIQFIDGEAIDCDVAKAWGINQANIGPHFDAVANWEKHEKQVFIIAVGEVGYNFDSATVEPGDFDVALYYVRGIKELAEEFVADGQFGEIPDHLIHYIDYDAIARDLACDYSETDIAGDIVIYRAA